MVSEKELHYLGGIYDAEGHFGIQVGVAREMRLGYEVRPVAYIGMKLADGSSETRELVKRFAEENEFGTGIYERDTMWKFEAGGAGAIEVMEEILPYLKLKASTVEQILAVDWDSVRQDKSAFIDAMIVRDSLRESNNRTSKYDAEYFREEFEVESESATETEW